MLIDSKTSDDPEIADVVAQLRRLRAASQLSRYRGPAPRLPSREAIGEIVENLVSALYPRHFGPPGLSARDADAFVAKTLSKTRAALREQITLALALEQEHARGSVDANQRSADEITSMFLAALPKIRATLDKDARAALAQDPSAKSIDEVIFCFPGVAAVRRHRLAHELYQLGAPMLARIVAEIAHAQAGVDIHPGAEIGEGFFIDHGTGVVIGETAIIGRNVRLYQAVTLGARSFQVAADGQLRKNYPRHPIVEDDVVIYAGATILGRITIGRGSSIGGNVWLTESVPPGSRITQAKTRADIFGDGDGV
ncbi:MAG: serine acetyltransferase [Hyphomicrobiales bacterium]|nr:serine acetyltransferase [Hyphomicrobiales bacterium]